ncbi:E3 SUMO-protein ligase ZBED1, partial [Frankliniella fusca]
MGKQSAVWNYFSKIEGGKKVKCSVCSEHLTYKNTTSNLLLHLVNKHKINVQVLPAKGGKRKRFSEEGKQANTESAESDTGEDPDDPPSQEDQAKRRKSYEGGPLDRCISNQTSFSEGGSRDKDCTNALMFMIVKDNLPLSTPEKPGFRVFTKTLQPLYHVPSEPTLTKCIEAKYLRLKLYVGDLIAKAQHITLTMDLWTHKYTMRSHLGVTAHLTIGSKIRSFELGARLMEERKTEQNISAAIRKICEEWQIDSNKVRACVTDGGANIRAAARAEFGDSKHIVCVCHRLNLIGQKAIGNMNAKPPSEQEAAQHDLPEDEEDLDVEGEEEAGADPLRALIIKVKKTVRFFRQSEVARARLDELQKAERGKTESSCLKLIQEVKTRWNSCYDMLERYLLLAPLVNRVILELQRSRASKARPPQIMTAEEEDTLKEVKDLLSPLARATLELSTEKNVTLSKCIPVVRNLRNDIEKFQPTTGISFNLKENLIKLINNSFAGIEGMRMFAISTLLDPRFKKFAFFQDQSAPRRIANAVSWA